MGIKYCETKKYYIVSYSRRHPLTKKSRNLRRVGIKSIKEANRVYKQLIVELTNKFNDVVDPYWPEVVSQFLIHFANKGITNNTLINYESSLKAHTFIKWGKVRVNNISTSDIRELLLEDLSRFSEAHKKSMLKFIRAVFRFALESNLVLRDPMPRIIFKTGDKIQQVLNEEEVKQLLKEARERKHPWFHIWAIACFTGLRSGELYALRWEKVDLNNRTMVISNSWTKEDGYKETKSGDDRVVEIAPNLVFLMKELLENKTNDFVLPHFREWEYGDQAKILQDFLKVIELPRIRFHDLRASWATIMLSKGIEPIKVMSMGGWKDLKTMQIYIRKSGINIRGITDNLCLITF